MRYNVIRIDPAQPDELLMGLRPGSMHIVAQTDDLELGWLILNWYDAERLVANERIGIWDRTLDRWLTPDKVITDR